MVLVFDYLYNTASSYAFGSKELPSSPGANAAARRSRRSAGGGATFPSSRDLHSSTNGASSNRVPLAGEYEAESSKVAADRAGNEAKYAMVDSVLAAEDLYVVLGISNRKCKTEEIRRAFLSRSRVCHPDKFPNYPPSTSAFQKLSFAYETLSKPSSRRIYDLSGRTDYASAMADGEGIGSYGRGMAGEDTLNSVLYQVFCEFMEGDFEMVRVFVNAANEGNPGLNLGESAVENLESVFRKMREVLLTGQKLYLRVVKFELIRLYEIQHSLRQLSYFDVFGRLRLTMQLARVTLSIPMAIDQVMRQEDSEEEEARSRGETRGLEAGHDGDEVEGWVDEDEDDEVDARPGMTQKDGLLGPRVAWGLGLAVGLLEKGEGYMG